MDELKKAEALLNAFCMNEYGHPAELSDLECVNIAYTENDEGVTVQVSVNLVDCKITTSVDGKVVEDIKYYNLNELNEQLKWLSFDDLVSGWI